MPRLLRRRGFDPGLSGELGESGAIGARDPDRAIFAAMTQEVGAAGLNIPSFNGDDVTRAFAGAYLPLCRALREAGAIDPHALAVRILARLGPEREASWAVLAISLAHVLIQETETSRG